MIVSQKPDHIRNMFASIARRYDLINHLLSLGTDIYWRRAVVHALSKRIEKNPILALDLCCGTADLSLALSKVGWIVGCDFCHPMLTIGRDKIRRKNKSAEIFLAEGDALHLPFHDNTFDAITIGFGLRNLADTRDGLREMRRVLRTGGVLVILEFSKPVIPGLRELYKFYFKHILPRIGRWVSGEVGPYSYLPFSVEAFPDQEKLKSLLKNLGYRQVDYQNLSGGIAALHIACK
ncbi:MAG: bifunctional demethylmenaquinone methyltransferase/2-methoxy-6-polyprenyl-1,4-benzoquinol methylase UbiE [Acidobacteria bacterium]|nr:bifunctional demethylmenaquinone methyltransferase/2-methoxy-6-polyprenyl-1,4-benzoquinol methylase UbiE [Acidobacteriota bacterium]MBI3655690.1 bifunctional demethylmenaquinone methyltransferase/2-methoxy-6-polyprenyl-1,4-benzoquinol methylase UbiE [Acidobacteriota bacterium]